MHSSKLEAITSKYSRGLETRLVRAPVVRANFLILFEMSLVLRPSSHDKHSHNMASTEARKGTKRSTRFAEYDQDPKEKRIKRNFMNKALLTETFKSRAAEFYR